MVENDIIELDKTIIAIKQKGTQSTFHKFDFDFIITLEIVRYEILTYKSITDETAEAITQLFAFQSHEFYYRDFPELYSKCSSLFSLLIEYNNDLKNNDLSSLGVKDKKWIKYYTKAIKRLILSNKPNN